MGNSYQKHWEEVTSQLDPGLKYPGEAGLPFTGQQSQRETPGSEKQQTKPIWPQRSVFSSSSTARWFYSPGEETRFVSPYPTNIIPGVCPELVPPQEEQWPHMLPCSGRQRERHPNMAQARLHVLQLEHQPADISICPSSC